MAENKETRISKNSTFEEWRSGTNKVSFDLGPVASDGDKSADSLDKETRLTDQAKVVQVANTVVQNNVDVGSSAGWFGYNAFSTVVNSGPGSSRGDPITSANINYVVSNGVRIPNSNNEIPYQKFSVAANGNITLAPNTKIYELDTHGKNEGFDPRDADGEDGGYYVDHFTFIENYDLKGKTATFSGTVTPNMTLHSRYNVKAFIKYLNRLQGFNLVEETVVDLRTTPNGLFSIELNIPNAEWVVPQVGFIIEGQNANQSDTTIANTSVEITNVALTLSAGQTITSSEEFIRDQSYGSNDLGMRIDLSPDEKLDMTAGYIVFTGTPTTPTDFTVGSSIEQYVGNDNSNSRVFGAEIVGVVENSSNGLQKLLLTNATGIFDPTLILGSATNYSTSAQQIPAANIVRQIVGSLDVGYVRVYKTDSSNNVTRLVQSVTEPDGFHIPKITGAIPFSQAVSTIPATYLEGERIYQTSNNNQESGVNRASFSAKILAITSSSNYGLGSYGGILLYDIDGAFSPSLNLRGTTADAVGGSPATISSSKYSIAAADVNIPNTFASIIRLNTPAQTGESYELEFSSAVDAIVELQDDIGKVEDLVSNATQAEFGANGQRKVINTEDIVTTLNSLQDMVGTATIPTFSNNTHLIPNNVSTISGLAKSVVDFIGDTDLSNNTLGATANTSSTLTDAITTIKNFIGSVAINDLGVSETITGTIAQLHDEVGDVKTLDATGSATAGGFDTEVLTTALIELRTLVCPGDIDDAQTALSANVAPAANFAATTNTDGVIELQTIVGDRVGISTDDLIGTAAATNTIVGQINHIKSEIGTAALLTTSNGDIASAINELETNIRGTVDNYTITDNLPTDITYTVNNGIITAINTLTSFVGNVSLNAIGSSNTITSAVDKMHVELGDVDTLNTTPTAYNDSSGQETDGIGGFRSAAAGTASESTVVSALTELRQALLGDTAALAAVTNARTDTTISATIQNAITDLDNLAGYSKTNIIDAILEIQDLMGNVTTLNNADNDFNSARITDSLIELKTALVGDGDLTDTIATLNVGDETDFSATTVVNAIAELQTDLGQQSLLTASPFHADLHGSYSNADFQLAINAITGAIGNTDIGDAINSGNETLTNAIAQLRTDLGDVGISGTNLTTTADTLGGAINELHAEIGEVLDLDNAVGYTQTTLVPAITEIQGLIGQVATLDAGLGVINTHIQRNTNASASANANTIQMADTTGIVPGMTVLNTASGRTSSIATGTKVTTVNANSVAVDTPVVSTIQSGDTLRFDTPTIVNAIKAIDARIGDEITSTSMGTTATTLVPAIKEITDELGDVTAGNLGTTSSNITAAIKEIVDGTGAATITVNNAAGQQPTGKLDKVSDLKQTILSDIDFDCPDPNVGSATTTFKFGPNTVLDLSDSAATLKMTSDAAGTFNIVGTFLRLEPSARTGTGLEIERTGITDVALQTDTNAFFQWKEQSISSTDPNTGNNQNDLAWEVKGFESNTTAEPYTEPNLDFQNAYRLFSIGTTNVANSMQNVTVTWDATNHNFDVSLNNTTTDMTGGGSGPAGSSATAGLTAWGTTAKIPQIHVDRQGRIAGIAEVDMADFLGSFTLKGDSGTAQTVESLGTVDIAGSANNIVSTVSNVSGVKTITLALDNNISVTNNVTAGGNVTASGNGSIGGTLGVTGNTTLGGTLTVTGDVDFDTAGEITLGTADTTINAPGELNVFNLNVSGTQTTSTVSNTTISGDAFVLRAENSNSPSNSDTPKFVVGRGFSTTKNITQLVAGKRYKIVSGTGFTSLGASNNDAGTVFTATGAGTGTATAKLQRDEAAIVWNEQYDQFVLTRAGAAGAVSTNTQQGAIIAQGDTIGSATKFTAAANANNENKQVLFADVTGSTSQLQRNSGLLFNPSTNKLTLSSGQLDLGNFKHLNGVTNINTSTNTKPLEISRGGSSATQLMKIGITDTVAIFNYIEDTADGGEGKNNFGKYRFLLNGNHDDADEITNRIGLEINKDSIIARGLTVNTNGINVTGGNTSLLATTITGATSITGNVGVTGETTLTGDTDIEGVLAHRPDTLTQTNKLGRSAGSTKVAAEFTSRVAHATNYSRLRINDVRLTTNNANQEHFNTSEKRLQHMIDSSNTSFVGMQATSSNVSFARLGGMRGTTTKTYIKGGTQSATELYHNVASGAASTKVLNTMVGGVKVNGIAAVTQKIGIGTDSPTYKLDIGKTTSHADNTIRIAQANAGTAIRIGAGGGNSDVVLLRVDGDSTVNKHDGTTDAGAYGFSLKYMGSREGNKNSLAIMSDNRDNATQVEALTVLQDGKIGIGTDAPDTTLHVDGTAKANSFVVIRDAASEIKIQKASGTSTLINKVVLSNTNSNDKGGVIHAQSTQLGSTIGSSTTQATFATRNGNESYLQIIDERSVLSGGGATTNWTEAHKRIEFGIDSTRMAYLAANWNENYGFEIGSAARNGSDPFRSNARPWIRFKRAASYNGPGAVELYHGTTNSGGSSKKFETTSDGAEISGNLLLNSNTSRLRIGNHANYNANSNTSGDVANSAIYVRTNDGTDAKVVIEADSNNASEGANPSLILYQDGQRVGGKIELTNDTNLEATDCLPNSLLISHLHNDTESNYGLQFATDGDAPEYGSILPKVRMTILSEGNVGIGLNNPAEKLDVIGNIKLSGEIDQNGTGVNDFEGQIDCNKDVKTTASGKGFYAFGGGTDYLKMTHDGAGGHITSSDKLEISTPTFAVLSGNSAETLISATQNAQVDLYFNNAVKAKTMGPYADSRGGIVRNYSGGLKIEGPSVAIADYGIGELMKDTTLQTGRIQFDGGYNTTDWAEIRYVSGREGEIGTGNSNSGWLDFLLGDDLGGNDRFRFRFNPAPASVNGGNEYTLIDIYPKSNSGSTFMDLTPSAGSDSEVKAGKFTGNLVGNADTATTVSTTLAINKGGTNATSFSNKAAIVMNDAGTAFTSKQMDGNGELLIGGSSGPESNTLGAGTAISIANGNNSISIAADIATTSTLGVAKFNTANFAVTSGDVTIKDGGVATAEIADDNVTYGKIQNVTKKRMLGRTADSNGNIQELTDANVRSFINVANGANNFSFKVQANTSGSDSLTNGQTLTLKGSGATSVARSGNSFTISSNNTTYKAAGGDQSSNAAGIYLDSTTFKIGYVIRPHKTMYVGNSLKTQILFHGSAGQGRSEDPYINFYTSQSGSRAMTMRAAKHMTDRNHDVSSGNGHKATLYGMYSAEVDKTTPTYSKELTSKAYVDAQRSRVAACHHNGGSSKLQTYGCSVSKVTTGVYRITLSSGYYTSSTYPVAVASIARDITYDADILAATTLDRQYEGKNHNRYSTIDELNIHISCRRDGSSRNKIIIETYKHKQKGIMRKGNDHYNTLQVTRTHVDLPWQCIIYSGRG